MIFVDLFSGIGGFRLGMEDAGHECFGFVERDKYARKSYEAIHDVEGEWSRHDITEVSNEEWRELRGKVDVICAGFPCQAFSVGGKRGGFEDTRGTMFFEVARAAKQIKPRYLFIENVKGLLSHDKGNTFGTILNTLDELGYDVEWEVCNSKNFVPQNRERVFIIGHLRGTGGRKVFPLERSATETNIKMKGMLDTKGNESIRRVYDIDGISPTITAKQGGGHEPKIAIQSDDVAIPVSTPSYTDKKQNGRRFKENGDPMFTLTAQDIHGVMIKEATKKGYAIANEGDSINLTAVSSKTRRGRVGKGIANTIDTSMNQGTLTNFRIRRLTPRECFRLQGFPDWAFDRAQAVNSDSQLYKQAGNTVTVPLIKVIAERFEV